MNAHLLDRNTTMSLSALLTAVTISPIASWLPTNIWVTHKIALQAPTLVTRESSSRGIRNHEAVDGIAFYLDMRIFMQPRMSTGEARTGGTWAGAGEEDDRRISPAAR